MKKHYEKLIEDENYIQYFINLLNGNFRDDLDYSKEIIDNLLLIAKEKKYKIVKAWANAFLGWYFHDLANYDEALSKHNKAYETFITINNIDGQIFVLNGIMADYIQLGFYDLAIEAGLQGIKLGEESGLEQKIHSIRVNTAISYIRLNLFDEALEIFNELEKISYVNSKESQVIIACAKAEIFMNKGNTKKALECIGFAFDCMDGNKDNVLIADILYVSGQIHEKLQEDEVALYQYNEALKISEDNMAKDVCCLINKSLGAYYCKKGIYDEALYCLRKALNYVAETKALALKAEIVKELSKVYKLTNDYEKALEYSEMSLVTENELFHKQSGLWLAKLQDKQIMRQATVYKSLYDEIALLSSIGQKITSDLNLENILHNVYNEVTSLFKFDVIGIALYKEEQRIIDYSLFIEDGKKVNIGSVSIDDNSSFGSYCINNKESILINNRELEYHKYINYTKNYAKTYTGKMPNSLIYSPLTIENKAIGFLSIQSYESNIYNLDDLNKIKILASYLAIALANATLFNEVEFFATHDYLTGLWNRKEVCERGQHAFNKMKRYGEVFSIIMTDVDKFKNINDTFGHLIGDEVLKVVANTISSSVRDCDYVGRYGGEEFLIILPNTTEKGAFALAERIRENVQNTKILTNDNKWTNATISLGIFECSDNISTLDEGLNNADYALYKAKNSGKNKVVVY